MTIVRITLLKRILTKAPSTTLVCSDRKCITKDFDRECLILAPSYEMMVTNEWCTWLKNLLEAIELVPFGNSIYPTLHEEFPTAEIHDNTIGHIVFLFERTGAEGVNDFTSMLVFHYKPSQRTVHFQCTFLSRSWILITKVIIGLHSC